MLKKAGEARTTVRSLMDAASFGPDALKAIGQAFDEAWKEIAGNFGNEPAEIEAARLKLAKALLSVADDDSRDVEVANASRVAEDGVGLPHASWHRPLTLGHCVSKGAPSDQPPHVC